MVLSGTLKEFILADIFNLLTMQKVTGRLILNCDKREGGIVFKDGIIVGADCGEENLPNKLFNYMIDIKRKSPDHVSQLFDAHAGSLNVLAANILERNLMSQAEMKSFTESCVEDICCSLLTWHRGTYRFNPQRGVAPIACGFVTIPIENIVMEGMRRVDEWARMQEFIKGDMIFVPAAKGVGRPEEFDVNSTPEEYILSLLDGTRTVENIKKTCCICEYRVYESLNALLQAGRVTALQEKYSQSIKAALRRKNAEDASALDKTFVGSILSVAAAIIVAALFIFCRIAVIPAFLPPPGGASAGITDAARAAALLQYAITGEKIDNPEALKRTGLLTEKDF
ncbi:MAG: DUF4388 domain-containing protein [Chitinispirillia bacterium]|nr:DUF4388 domain-containing protein [Chitinispirillia bacterium]MCL2242236.1 DUF4388 domain-containing protein [Chitinispirillia bacterium]